jgi:hypothetical protein
MLVVEASVREDERSVRARGRRSRLRGDRRLELGRESRPHRGDTAGEPADRLELLVSAVPGKTPDRHALPRAYGGTGGRSAQERRAELLGERRAFDPGERDEAPVAIVEQDAGTSARILSRCAARRPSTFTSASSPRRA